MLAIEVFVVRWLEENTGEELTDLDPSTIESNQDSDDGDVKEPDYVNEDGVHELVLNELLMETGVMAVTALLGQSGMEEPAMRDSLLLCDSELEDTSDEEVGDGFSSIGGIYSDEPMDIDDGNSGREEQSTSEAVKRRLY